LLHLTYFLAIPFSPASSRDPLEESADGVMEVLRTQSSATWDQHQVNPRNMNHPHMANHIVTHSAEPLQQYHPTFPMTPLGPQSYFGMMHPRMRDIWRTVCSISTPFSTADAASKPMANRPRASNQIRLWPLRILETAIKLTNRGDESCKLQIRRLSVGLYRKCRRDSLQNRNGAPKQPKQQPNFFTSVYFD
jgi:hypothetical protein